MTLLMTGFPGFLGSALLPRLLARGPERPVLPAGGDVDLDLDVLADEPSALLEGDVPAGVRGDVTRLREAVQRARVMAGEPHRVGTRDRTAEDALADQRARAESAGSRCSASSSASRATR